MILGRVLLNEDSESYLSGSVDILISGNSSFDAIKQKFAMRLAAFKLEKEREPGSDLISLRCKFKTV